LKKNNSTEERRNSITEVQPALSRVSSPEEAEAKNY